MSTSRKTVEQLSLFNRKTTYSLNPHSSHFLFSKEVSVNAKMILERFNFPTL